MNAILWIIVLIFGLLQLSEAKPCPESTRPHKTRCDAYFKCMVLPSKSHVWVPEKCGEGLIYEPNLKICVLPGDDWECNLGDGSAPTMDDNNIYGIKNIDANITDFKINNSSLDTVQLDSDLDSGEEIESSGDGDIPVYMEAVELEIKESDDDETEIPSPSAVDPKLSANLQRLSQLIDGLKQTYQKTDSPVDDLRPDQLNAFLAHYNIKSEFNAIDPTEMKVKGNETTGNQTALNPETKVVLTNLYHPKRKPHHGSSSGGYSNSQIVVNRPEGSVLFTLPSHQQSSNHQQYGGYEHTSSYHDEPKISEETLKTVLELSKQMLANQNIRQVFPANNYYQPLVQPIYLPAQQYPNYGHQSYNEDKKYNKYSQSQPSASSYGDRKPPTTIIHNNVMPVHVTGNGVSDKDKIDSYGHKIDTYNKPDYPPYHSEESNEEKLPTYSNYGSYQGDSEENSYNQPSDRYETHHHHRYPSQKPQSSRYENNQLITVGSQQSNSYNQPQQSNSYNQQEGDNYQYHKYQEFTTPRPAILTRPISQQLTDFYTHNPHLDESNVNNVFQIDRYPTLQYGELPRPININRPANHGSSISSQTTFLTPIAQHHASNYQHRPNPYYHHQHHVTPSPLFPPNINPAMIDISPNSYKSESMETTDDDDTTSAGDADGGDDDTGGGGGVNHEQIVTNDLASAATNLDQSDGKKPLYYKNVDSDKGLIDGSQLVNLGGNFISYDVFKNQLIPALSSGNDQSIDDSNVEIITCSAGIRQPNVTDCTKYYVCSKKDGKVLAYSCPPYTGFNAQTRICDAKTYSLCNPEAIINRFTVTENRKIQLEAMKALQDAKRIRDQQAFHAQSLVNFMNTSNRIQQNKVHSNPTVLNSYVPGVKPVPTTGQKRPGPAKKRKYYCREGDKIPDQTSIYNYFVCYKSNGMMKGHRMTCSKGLLFCPKTSVCTLPQKCN